jgi:hypothetical protein
MKVVYLTIRTYIGTLAYGASHYYGALNWGTDEKDDIGLPKRGDIDLEHTLTKREAAALNKDSLFDYNWKAGGKYHGFSSEEAVTKEGIKVFKALFTPDDILVLGDHVVADPQRILVGPQDVMDFVNPLVDEKERIGSYEKSPERTHEISKIFWKYWTEKGYHGC